MLVTNPVGDHHAVAIRFHALHNAFYHLIVYDAGKQPVFLIRATHPVSFNQLHTQVIRLPHALPHWQHGEGITVHHVGKEGKLL